MITYLWAQMSHEPERWADNGGQTLCSCLDGCLLCLLSHTFVIVTALRNCFDKKDFNLLFKWNPLSFSLSCAAIDSSRFQSDFQMYPQTWWSGREAGHLSPSLWSIFFKFTSVLIAELSKTSLDRTEPQENSGWSPVSFRNSILQWNWPHFQSRL